MTYFYVSKLETNKVYTIFLFYSHIYKAIVGKFLQAITKDWVIGLRLQQLPINSSGCPHKVAPSEALRALTSLILQSTNPELIEWITSTDELLPSTHAGLVLEDTSIDRNLDVTY